jgi:hypothetical protein
MAKESIKARERKREHLVAKYATKRAALKAAGDYAALDKLPKNSRKMGFIYAKIMEIYRLIYLDSLLYYS